MLNWMFDGGFEIVPLSFDGGTFFVAEKRRSLWGGDLRKLSGFSEFGIVSVPPGDAVAF